VTAHPVRRGDVAVLVVAAGMGLRMGPGLPKALRLLHGEPLLTHAVRRVAAAESVAAIVVAAPPDEVAAVAELLAGVAPVTVVPGGATRQESVAAALAAAPQGLDIVLVHDAARALAPSSLVEAVAAAVRAGCDAVIPVLPVVDTVKEVDAAGIVVGTVDRAALRAVQTPQGFRRAVLAQAHTAAGAGQASGASQALGGRINPAAVDSLTDDAGLVEKLGVRVHCVPGSEHAFKITRPVDLALAHVLGG
jgi:2-C-methyl-D-erythritol 4-phosphate cytidylyltransferase